METVRNRAARVAVAFTNVVPARFSGMLQLVLDLVGWAGALLLATYLRLDFSLATVNRSHLAALLLVGLIAQTATGFTFSLYQQRWRFGSLDEVSGLVRAALATTLCLTTVDLLVKPRIVPVSATLMSGLVGLVCMFAVRYVWRLSFEASNRPDVDVAVRTIVFGAGEAGSEIVRSLRRNPRSPYLPVAVLDDEPTKQRQEVSRVRVQGTRHDLVAVAKKYDAKTLLIAMPSASPDLVNDLNRSASEAHLDVKILPPVHELFNGQVNVKDIRSLTEVDLLGRRQIETNLSSIAGYLRGRRVLVTGAGGSIGSELCRQLAAHGPERLLMLDRDESALQAVQMSLDGRALLDTPNLILADIRDRDHLTALFAELKPHVVFHAAALKHLPLLERYPSEAVKSNVFGTLNVIEAAIEAGVEQFVNISTDKAANPICALGYSKRVAERLTAAAAKTASGTYLSVRFGNVLGSRGSVIPAFRAMIEAGGPVTVTEPDVTRFMMTIPEAVQLVIQAGAIGRPAEVLVLDMGQAIRIDDLAHLLIRESGKDIPIVYTGLRPGEKLHEELFGDGEVDVRPVHHLISHADVPVLDVNRLLDVDLEADQSKIMRDLRELAFAPTDPVELGSPAKSARYIHRPTRGLRVVGGGGG